MAVLPHGTVTLFFTDVEGSTQLLQRLGPGYAEVLADHRTLLREAVEAQDGYVVDHRGDEFFIVFEDAARAAAAAIAAQRAFAENTWPQGVDLRVRMGMHTGEPDIEDDAYVGLDVHRAARIAQTGNGGQILLSERTRAALDSCHKVEDLGEHQLPGLSQPERLFQLSAPGLPSRFPALSTARGGLRGMRVVLADDAVVLRDGLARVLVGSGVEVAAQVGTALELLAAVDELTPDIAIVDIRMPPTMSDEGLVAAEQIRQRHPDVGVLLLSQYVEASYALRLLDSDSGRIGYLLKDRVLDIEEFVGALERVAGGETVVDPALVAQLVDRAREDDPLEELTSRERDVLALMAEGLTDKGIAQRLFVTPKTVETHVGHIFAKLDIPATSTNNRRVHAVITYLRS